MALPPNHDGEKDLDIATAMLRAPTRLRHGAAVHAVLSAGAALPVRTRDGV